MGAEYQFCYEQIHIDAARNATDDFNPFHEPRKCFRIRGNPYPGSIVLGFQLECLVEYLVTLYRNHHDEFRWIEDQGLAYSNYHLTFADALLPGERFSVDIKPTHRQNAPPTLANRVIVRKETGFVLMGYKRETAYPLCMADLQFGSLPDLRKAKDRAFLAGTDWFLKRKFMSTGNAKNFLAGSLADQGYFFDELEGRANFPDMFPCSLVSCALLEKAVHEGHDFIAEPVVYLSHTISVDRRLARSLRSNEALHMLVRGPLLTLAEGERGLIGSGAVKQLYGCVGLVRNQQILYRCEVSLVSLDGIVSARIPKAA